ncbi:something about silencing protein 10 [Procambarus clarkii]|uniref:something about silencing protein 10 n=1 Tax=Procambarus clarkii TaxID=6728 RepID=UPI0037441086
MEDDIVDEPDFKLPDERAWGKNKWRYIGTDTTDEKIAKKLHSQDEELAKLEEETARKLQERMAAELHDLVADDLILHEEDKPKDVALKSTLEVDLSGLSRTKKLQLLQRESPEFMPLFDDLKEKCEEINSLAVLMEGVKTRQIESVVVSQYITTKYRLTLNYLCVLCMYMFTKCSQSSVGSHPVVSRLAQYRQLLQELKPCDDKLEADLKCLIPEIILARTTKLNPTPNSTKEKPRKQEKLQVLNKKNVTKTEKKKRKLSDLLSDSQMLDDKGGLFFGSERREKQVIEASSDEGQE